MADNTEKISVVSPNINATKGSVGLDTQVPGSPTTVTAAAEATGGVGAGKFIESDIDAQLFKFKGDDTPLMQLMLKAKTVNVDSAEVEHYMIDEPKSAFNTNDAVDASTAKNAFVLPLSAEDQNIPQESCTLLVKGVSGYDETGQTQTKGKDLMLFVTGRDDVSSNPIVRAVNGPKTNKTDAFCTVPAIPTNSEIVLLANALYETQKEVAPDLVVPQPSTIYLQKRGMNQIVSDYFESQKKHIPFSQALIAEQAITNFKTRCNRTLWAGRKGKFAVNTKLGPQYVYTTEGVRWQFKRELQHTGKWAVEKIIALAKMFFTGEDVPKTAILLAGKNMLEQIQCIDYSKHPEIQITTKVNPVGWEVTNFHTVFGDIQIKREPTLDKLGWSNSGALLGEDRLVHYKRVTDHEFNEKVIGEEATRKGLLVWDGLALKGSCHIWIDGEGDNANSGATTYAMWDSTDKPTTTAGTASPVYYLLSDCTAIASNAKAGTMWQFNGTAWVEYSGELFA